MKTVQQIKDDTLHLVKKHNVYLHKIVEMLRGLETVPDGDLSSILENDNTVIVTILEHLKTATIAIDTLDKYIRIIVRNDKDGKTIEQIDDDILYLVQTYTGEMREAVEKLRILRDPPESILNSRFMEDNRTIVIIMDYITGAAKAMRSLDMYICNVVKELE